MSSSVHVKNALNSAHHQHCYRLTLNSLVGEDLPARINTPQLVLDTAVAPREQTVCVIQERWKRTGEHVRMCSRSIFISESQIVSIK